MTVSKILQAAASSSGGVATALDVDDVFSTYLYTGNGTDNRAINNGIDLSGKGGMVWIKNRDFAFDHLIGDTERGITKGIRSNTTAAENNFSDRIKTVTSTGFTIGTADEINSSNTGYTGSLMEYVSWTFRKAPKFFDIQTWNGDGTNNRAIGHNLGTDAGMVLFKRTDSSGNWIVWHRSNSYAPTEGLALNQSSGSSSTYGIGNGTTEPDNGNFYVSTNLAVENLNATGGTYVAYLFAHNNSDGAYGPSANQDIIKCGNYTGTGTSTINTINLGFEPQWVLFKRVDSGDNWYLLDSMRGFVDLDTGDKTIIPNASNVEQDINTNFFGNRGPRLTATGFEFKNTATVNGSTGEYVYVAIRRGPLAVPTSASDVFAVDQGDTTTTNPQYVSNFVVDMAFDKDVNSTGNSRLGARLIQGKRLYTNTTSAQGPQSNFMFDYNTGWYDSQQNSNFYAWMWKRAPNFFDIVTYEGTGNARNINHNLGVAPEMIWIKQTNVTNQWIVYHKDMGNNKYMVLNSVNAPVTSSSHFNNTTPSTTTFTIGTDNDVNETGGDFISFHFSTLAGISKVGSYTGNGSTSGLTIDCGFSNGAKFVLIKAYGDNSNRMHWYVFDSVRGITFGNDYWIELDTAEPQQSVSQAVKPDNSGFQVVGSSATGHATINKTGETYIFYAVAI